MESMRARIHWDQLEQHGPETADRIRGRITAVVWYLGDGVIIEKHEAITVQATGGKLFFSASVPLWVDEKLEGARKAGLERYVEVFVD